MSGTDHQYMLGMRLDYIEIADFAEIFTTMARERVSGYCCVSNVHQCILTYDDPRFREQVNSATFVIPDSTILQKARSWRYSVPMIPTIRGSDLMLELCRLAGNQGIKIALIGGKDDKLLSLLQGKLLEKFENLEITFTYSPPFRDLTKEEDTYLVEKINSSGASIVFVGLGCPKQERWMATHKNQVAAMMIGVGAAFDFNAGIVTPSPKWVHALGLEWGYRLIQEPKRLWKRYLSTSPRFLWLLLVDRFSASWSKS